MRGEKGNYGRKAYRVTRRILLFSNNIEPCPKCSTIKFVFKRKTKTGNYRQNTVFTGYFRQTFLRVNIATASKRLIIIIRTFPNIIFGIMKNKTTVCFGKNRTCRQFSLDFCNISESCFHAYRKIIKKLIKRIN